MCKLTKKFFSDKPPTEELEISVEYNPETDTVDDILSIKAREFSTGIVFDLTNLYTEHLSGHLDTIVSEIDWYDIYRAEKKPAFHGFDIVDFANKLVTIPFFTEIKAS